MEDVEITHKFQAHIQRGGVGLLEMRRLLEAFAEHGDLEKLRDQAFKENLLGKTSSHLVKDMIYAFKRRFLQPIDLPTVDLVSQAMCSSMVDSAKTQANHCRGNCRQDPGFCEGCVVGTGYGIILFWFGC